MTGSLANQQPTSAQTAIPADQAEVVRDLIRRTVRNPRDQADVIEALGLAEVGQANP